ncbi:MAG TPA: hypothetical protein VFM14_07110 [Gemmatimonadales bacterium]|nr:hypothetical protein [Gemmatimonadales bacterium]
MVAAGARRRTPLSGAVETVRILRLAAGGDGVGNLADGRTVFVPRTAPGDLATLVDVRRAKRFARARLSHLPEASPSRVDPPCPHYTRDECGGCQLQHLGYPTQLEARGSFVGDALRKLAGLSVPDPSVEPADTVLGYRTKLTLSARGRHIGLHKYGRPGEVFDLEWCHITAAPLNQLWQAVRRRRTLLPAGLDRVVLRLDRAGGRHLLARVVGSRVWAGAKDLAGALVNDGTPASLWWQPENGAARVVAGDRHGAGHVDVFEQVNPAMAHRARLFAVDRMGAMDAATVWDLYAGVGDTTVLLSERGGQVHSVEREQRAVDHAKMTGPPAHRHAGLAELAIETLPDPELVIANPPRVGMDPRVPAVLIDRAPRRIVYISCDAATLARDITRLAPAYRLVETRCFDLFPQTAHIETVAILERA